MTTMMQTRTAPAALGLALAACGGKQTPPPGNGGGGDDPPGVVQDTRPPIERRRDAAARRPVVERNHAPSGGRTSLRVPYRGHSATFAGSGAERAARRTPPR